MSKKKPDEEEPKEESEITEIDAAFEETATSRFGATLLRWIITLAVALAFGAALPSGGEPSVVGAALAGVLVGGAAGFFYASWQQFFASEGASRTSPNIRKSSWKTSTAPGICPMKWSGSPR